LRKRWTISRIVANSVSIIKNCKLILMTISTEDGGRYNVYAKEPQMYYAQEVTVTHWEKAEKWNGRAAMIGIIAALGAYLIKGDIIPGLW